MGDETVKLLGIDPGHTTGWADWQKFGGFKTYGQIGPAEHHGLLWDLLCSIEADVIICESFEHHKANEAAELISLEYIGVVKNFCVVSSTRLVMQQSAIKTWASDAKLCHLGLFHTHATRNAADARRHLLYYLAHNSYVDKEIRTETLRSLKT